MNPTLAELYYTLGTSFQEAGLYHAAASAFRETLRFEPDFPEAYCKLGKTYKLLGLKKEAAAAIAEALRLSLYVNDACSEEGPEITYSPLKKAA